MVVLPHHLEALFYNSFTQVLTIADSQSYDDSIL